MIKLIILDFHGVIVTGDYRVVAGQMAREFEMDPKLIYEVLYKYHCQAAVHKLDEDLIFPLGLKELGIDKDPAVVREQHVVNTSIPNPEVVSYTRELRAKGICVIGLSKNVSKVMAENLERSGVVDEFDAVINTYDLNLPKASQKTMYMMMDRFGILKPSEVIIVDDQESNLVEPRKMGMHTIYFENFQQMKNEVDVFVV